MGILEAIRGDRSGGGMSLSEQNQALKLNQEFLTESIAALEDGMRDPEWRLTNALVEYDFTRRGLMDMIDSSRSMYLLNPLIQRSVDVTTYYTWAQGATFSMENEDVFDAVMKPLMDNDANRSELYDHEARIQSDVDQQVEGNIFIAMPTNIFGEVSVRTIPTVEIKEIIRKPGDAAVIMYYRRVWVEDVWSEALGNSQQVQREELYPDWRYHPSSKPSANGSLKINWMSPILHAKTGGTKKMDFGIPATYSSLPWAKAYKGFLEDWHTVVKSLSRFAWKATGKKKPIDRLKRRLQSTKGEDAGPETNPAPGVGSIFAGAEGTDLSPINKTGATIASDDSRPSRLMVSSGMGLPDTILSGDAQQGALATAKTLDRPTELYFVHRQAFWTSIHQGIARYAVDAAVRFGLITGGLKDYDRRTGQDMIVPPEKTTLELTFPPILEHDQKEVIEGINVASKFIPEETTSQLMLEALGVEGIKDALEQMAKEREERKARQLEIASKMGEEREFTAEEEKEIEEALGRLRAAVKSVDAS